MKFSILLGTYQRPDGKSPFYLKRALDSIFRQTHQDFRVYLMGDKYEDDAEFKAIALSYPQDRMYYENLPRAVEREKYWNNKNVLWNTAGLALANYTIDLILKDGFDYMCQLDHDDYWSSEHLEVLNNVVENTGTLWACTKALYIDHYEPGVVTDKEYVEYFPEPCRVIHSSTCINFRALPLRYRNVYEETGRIAPCDADLWERTTAYLKNHHMRAYFVNTLTCFHEAEGYAEGKVRTQEVEKSNDELVTGILVTYNTRDLAKRAYESVRMFHPKMKIIIVDGSNEGNDCYRYIGSLGSNGCTNVIQVKYNIGHGRGMCIGIYYAQTPYVLLFDSDIEMVRSPLKEMLALMEEDTFGVGYIEKTGLDGFQYGVKPGHAAEGWMRYLHPYFQLLQVSVYRKFYPYIHHGAPCFLTMLDIHRKGLSHQILKSFAPLGVNALGGEYIRHRVAGTRMYRKSQGQHEIEGTWELNNGQIGGYK
jgi:glycosyltransferase involved in cell wall biosynthesis